jgi:DNA-binding IclR family transcriptional regulator
MPKAPVDRSVAAVDRALNLLEAFAEAAGSIQSLDDLEKKTGLFKSVLCRYLMSFEKRGYVAKVGDGKYQLGTAVLRLGRTYERSFDIARHVMPILEELSKATRESASYYVRNNDVRMCLYRVDSPYSLRVSVQPGSFLPMDQSATGQVLRNFGTGMKHVERSADWVKASTNVGPEHSSSMSSPVFGVDGHLAGALTVSGPTSRFKPASNEAARTLLRAAAHNLSIKLGAPMSIAWPKSAKAPESSKKKVEKIQRSKK